MTTMKLDKIFSFLVPRDSTFFPFFSQAADNLVDTSEFLIKLIREDDLDKRLQYISAIKEAEHKGDIITKNLLVELNGTFITPFDREDIHELVTSIDTVVDLIHTTSKRILLYKIPKFPSEFVEFADCLHSAIKEIQFVLRNVKHAGDFIQYQDNIARVSQLESDADDLYQQYLSELFLNESNAIDLIRKRDILISMEKAIDKCEDVTGVFGTIAVKLR